MMNKPEKIRLLNQEEREIYGGAVIRAVEFVPAFRDGIALIRPFYDPSASTAYTDAYARVGLSKWFFNDLTPFQRASVILHETMHVLNSHIVRGEELGNQGALMNYAGDFEINCGLDLIPKVDLKFAIFPHKDPYNYERFKSMEQYFHMLKRDFSNPCPEHGSSGSKNDADSETASNSDEKEDESSSSPSSSGSSSSNAENDDSNGGGSSTENTADGQESGSNQEANGSGNQSGDTENNSGGGGACTCSSDGKKTPTGNPCDDASEARSAAADQAGVERASEIEQTLAKKNTNARIVEELKNKSRGDGAMNDFLSLAQRQMQPAKVSWQSIFRRVFSKMNDAVVRGRADYSYRRINRRSHGSEYIFPGMVQYTPQVMFGIDTSGSMSNTDYNNLLNEIEGIIRALSKGKDSLKVFTVDTTVKSIAPVSSVNQIKLYGGGGTDMSVAWKYVNSLPKKKQSDIFILATDGGTDWMSVERELRIGEKNYRSVILVTNKDGYNSVTAGVRQKAVVIDIS